MASYTLTASAADSLTGTADVADLFFVDAAGHLVGSDSLNGGTGTVEDRLVLTTAMTLGSAAFANVVGIERLQFNAGGGSSVTLLDAMAASAQTLQFRVDGGTGNDSLLGAGVLGKSLHVYGGGGNDLLESGGGGDRLSGGTGNDTLRGGAGNDRFSGGTGSDQLEAGTGSDSLDGGSGNDSFVFATDALSSADLLSDESGTTDQLQFSGSGAVALTASVAARISGIERFVFGSGNDVFLPGNVIGDSADADTLTVFGGAGDDRIDASAMRRLGTPLALRLDGGDGIDTLVGSNGNDTLDAGAGLGPMSGNAGDDVLVVRSAELTGTPALNGGSSGPAGDTLRLVGAGAVSAAQFASITAVEVLELDADGGDVVLPAAWLSAASALGFDFLVRGSAEDDRIDLRLAGAGIDTLTRAGDGDDTVLGGAGDDTAWAGLGVDEITLGTGTDQAVFLPGELGALDVVTADTVGLDRLAVTISAGRTLGASAFAGVQGFDDFLLTMGAGSAVRLPSNLVSQSGRASALVDVIATQGVVVDGRSASGNWGLFDGDGDDLLLGGSGNNVLIVGIGKDTVVGGDGGDSIDLGDTTHRDLAVIRAATDGTVDINGTLSAASLAGADTVAGTQLETNFIAVDRDALGLPGFAVFFGNAGGSIPLSSGVIVLPTSEEIAGNAFGSLSAVRSVVGSRLSEGTAGDDRAVLVIGGANEQQFGVYLFEDRDDNATVDTADLLYLLAIGSGDVPGAGSNRGFTTVTLDLG